MDPAASIASPIDPRRVFWILSIAIFTAMLGVGIILPLLPIYASQLGATGVLIGLIFSGFSLSRSLFSPIAGRLSDRWGRKPFIAFGLFLYWLISLGYLLAHTAVGVVFVRIAQGASAALIIPLAFAYVGDIAPKKHEGQYVGSFSVSLFAGFGFGPLIGGFIMHHYGVETNFYLMSSLCFIAFVVVLIFLPHQKLHEGPGQSTLPRYSALLGSSVSLGLFTVRFSNAFTRGTLMAFLPLIAHHQTSMTPSQIGVAISCNVLLISLLQAPFGRLADRYARWKLVVVGSGTFAAMMALIPACQGFGAMLGICIAMGFTGGLALPAATAMVVEEGRRFGMGSAMGFFNLGMSLGLGVGPILSGEVTDFLGLKHAFYLASLVGLGGSLGFLLFVRNRFADPQ
jgi:MFS family permease